MARADGTPICVSDWKALDGSDLTVGAVGTFRVDELEPCPTQPPANREIFESYLADLEYDRRALRISPLRVYLRDDQWYIVDGRHRWMVMRKLGQETVDCLVYPGPYRRWNAPQVQPLRFWHGRPESTW